MNKALFNTLVQVPEECKHGNESRQSTPSSTTNSAFTGATPTDTDTDDFNTHPDPLLGQKLYSESVMIKGAVYIRHNLQTLAFLNRILTLRRNSLTPRRIAVFPGAVLEVVVDG
ncbi:MAG: hypothetical protein J3R72DRAFT_497897 [Linnemannia gamsii]|nr:MAG: hypothetical protein J3R72DRAFT_497897 [Linnemannia gamsii]